ncbi:MAG TPA: MFS transporter, partial [Rugosimonospora sp.]|nr:MFS transporter [Rugosimonospora sp.]
MAIRQYARIWRLPGAPLLVVAGLVARLSIAMTPLALLLLVRQLTGEYTPAALTCAAYALAAAVAGPAAGRLSDRYGPTPVLLVTGLAHPAALSILLLATRGPHPLGPVLAAAVLAGGTYPPLTAAVRGAWNHATEPDTGRHELRATALAAETALFELVFVTGPLLVALFLALASPSAAIVASAAVTLTGTLTVARSRIMRSFRPHPARVHTRGLGPLRVPGFPALLTCAGGLGFTFGAGGVTVPAYATGHGTRGLAGLLLAIWAVGSTAGSFWYGGRHPRQPLSRQLVLLFGAVGMTLCVLAVAPGLVAFGVALAACGVTIGPALTVVNALVARLTPMAMMNEAYTWVITTSVAANAVGAAVAGVVVDRAGTGWALATAGLVVAG